MSFRYKKNDKSNTALKEISSLRNIIIWLCSSVAVNLILEILQRGSLVKALSHFALHLPTFLINTALIMFTTSLMLIVKRKWFAFAIPSVLWIIVGVTNAIVLSFRPLPISASDFRLAGEALEMMTLYMKPYQVVLIAIGLAVVILGLVCLFRFGPKYKTNIKRDLKVFVPLFVLLVAYVIIISVFDFFPRGNETPNEFYERNGFAYNFYKSAGSTGVYTPQGYTADKVDILKNDLMNIPNADGTDDNPNIIIIQLESFFDMTWMHGITLSEDPVPNFRKLCDENASGYLFVPSYGGGTSNVEFEVLTQMNLDHFTIGESPYYTLLDKDVLSDAMPFCMKKLGYTSHAIHNYNALFYKRNNAYSHLGFDTFTSVEYMNNLSFNSQGWTKDNILPDEILTALDSTKGKDFVFTVSVQGHGPYPASVKPDEFPEFISVDGDNLTSEAKAGLEYYASTIKEMDNMIGELVDRINACDEKCVLVLYGDHLPAIDFSTNYLSAPNAYTSEYVIYSNYGLSGEDEDIETYQLASHLQDMLKMNSGILTRYHQNYLNNETYQDDLKLLEFSMTNRKVAEYAEQSELAYSTHPVKISSVEINEEYIFVYGENFTPCSKISINDSIVSDTVFSSPDCIIARGVTVSYGDYIYVSQMARDGSEVLEVILPENSDQIK